MNFKKYGRPMHEMAASFLVSLAVVVVVVVVLSIFTWRLHNTKFKSHFYVSSFFVVKCIVCGWVANATVLDKFYVLKILLLRVKYVAQINLLFRIREILYDL